MKTILVPTDYSAPSKNAAVYAIRLASQLHAETIILYNAYQATPVITEHAITPTGTTPFLDLETLADISNTGMQHFKQSIESIVPAGLKIEHLTEYAAVDNEVDTVAQKKGADLIVMGITGTSKIEELLIGSTSINVMLNTKVPVIIVPSEASHTSVKNVMLACDYRKVVETTPVQSIKKLLDATGARLHVVNVYETDKELENGKIYQQELLRALLKDYQPSFNFLHSEDFLTAINDFVEKTNIDLVITIPKKHGFFEGLFKESHIKKLAFHSRVPVLCVHDEDL